MQEELALALRGRAMIVGVGDMRRGDDGVGPWVVNRLAQTGVQGALDSGVSPELEVWRIREFGPDSVLFVDAVDFGGSPGDVALLEAGDLRHQGFDTHRAPLRLTMDYLKHDLRCRCRLLAIQPKDVRMGAAICGEVLESAENVVKTIQRVLARET